MSCFFCAWQNMTQIAKKNKRNGCKKHAACQNWFITVFASRLCKAQGYDCEQLCTYPLKQKFAMHIVTIIFLVQRKQTGCSVQQCLKHDIHMFTKCSVLDWVFFDIQSSDLVFLHRFFHCWKEIL